MCTCVCVWLTVLDGKAFQDVLPIAVVCVCVCMSVCVGVVRTNVRLASVTDGECWYLVVPAQLKLLLFQLVQHRAPRSLLY